MHIFILPISNAYQLSLLSMRGVMVFILAFVLLLHASGMPRIMVATNRNVEAAPLFYGATVTDTLRFAAADSSATGYSVSSVASFRALAACADTGLPWLVFVHGDGKTFHDVLKRSFELASFYKVNILLFTYPTREQGLSRLENLSLSVAHAQKSRQQLAWLMDSLALAIQSGVVQPPVSWFFHSLGNYLLSEMVIESPPMCLSQKVFANMVVNAPAVNQRNHARWLGRLQCQQQIIVNLNRRDFTLWGAQLFSPFRLPLGRKVRGELTPECMYVRFNKVLGITGRRDAHSYYFGNAIHYNPHIKDYYTTVFGGQNPWELSTLRTRQDGTWYLTAFRPAKTKE